MEIKYLDVIIQLINFGIVAFALNYFLYEPIKKVLDQRAKKVEAGTKAAEENLKKQAELDKQGNEELKKARAEAKAILKDAQQKAEKQALDIIEKAKAEAKKAADKERKAIQANMVAEKEAMNSKVAEMVTEAVKAVLSGSLSTAEQNKIIEAQMKDIKKISFA